jgi:nucleoside-diphosphate-sugar epimerase
MRDREARGPMAQQSPQRMTVAVTGATGMIGAELLGLLAHDHGIHPVVAVDDPTLRDRDALSGALAGADAVVHLAADRTPEDARAVVAAAAAIGAPSFVTVWSATSPAGEDVERALLDDLALFPEIRWVVLRACPVVGPGALDAAAKLTPEPLRRIGGALVTIGGAAGLRPAVPAPPAALQFVHARDVARAIHRALVIDAAAGIYELGGDGLVEPEQVPRLLGLHTLPLPRALRYALYGWTSLLAQPLTLDSSAARRVLGWEPEFTSEQALAATRRALAI